MNAEVDGLIERYKRARADLAAAVQAVEKTKGEAIRAAMSWRDAEYLHQVGILTGDDVGLAEARQEAAAAIRGLEQAREALAAAQQGVADLEAVVKERRRELEAKARQNWVHQHRPHVVAALEAARRELEWAERQALSPDLLDLRREKVRSLEAQYRAALAEASVPELAGATP